MMRITAIKCKLKRSGAILLVLALCMQLAAVSASAANTSSSVDGTVEIYEWTRVDSQSDLPEDKNGHAVMLLYEWNGQAYKVDGNQYSYVDDDKKYFKLNPVTPDEGININAKTFRTRYQVSAMELQYTGEKDDDNGNAKICRLSVTDNHNFTAVALDGDGFYLPHTTWDEQKTTVLTPGLQDDASVKSGHVMLFRNVTLWADVCWMIDGSTGKVYAERERSWDLGQFVMYIGSKVTLSAVTHDVTVKSGAVANYNDYVYIQEGVTITIEKGGVLSVSGTLYNNGTIINNGGDIVVQKNATIEQFNLNGDYGGSICCDGGDLVILDGGRVSTGATDDVTNSYGSGFVLKNGATCTNFGTLIVGSSAHVISGATLDNRASGIMYFGSKIKSAYNGTLGKLDASLLSVDKVDDTFESTSIYVFSSNEKTCSKADLLYVGSDVMLHNLGVVRLDAWGDQLSDAQNISAKGSGKIKFSVWSLSFHKSFGWDLPQSWNTMLSLH